jgi:hypothetical protein
LTTFQPGHIIRPGQKALEQGEKNYFQYAVPFLSPVGIHLPVIPPIAKMQPIPRQEGQITLFTLLLILFAASMSYWLWRAHGQVALEIELACRIPAAEACASANARYMNSFYAAWLSQMFPWILPFIPAFIYVFFFRWLRKNKRPPAA